MVVDAVFAHPAFGSGTVKTYAKGSYPKNTNVRHHSDVDVVLLSIFRGRATRPQRQHGNTCGTWLHIYEVAGEGA
jgi:hypothetical protein